jgi:hypothetical protein
MPTNIVSIHYRSDAQRVLDAAERIRHADCVDAEDFAALMTAVGTVLGKLHKPPLTETEQWRWSAVVHQARRIAAKWSN